MNMPPRKGGVFMVKDRVLNMPPEDKRKPHEHRYIIIVSGNAANEDKDWPVVLAVPTSTSSELATEYCLPLDKGTGNLPKRCWARVTLIQPVGKADLGHYVGRLLAMQVELLEQNLLAYMGSVD
ncbi:MAG TPA: type II toxin-antitoxin system PemK/MazF family toxin [Streptosporangiaceae bacterium]|nr:type II toxin-antitoxin system PemK/MazF family toxin [Streptosporangiaceae bacterium]